MAQRGTSSQDRAPGNALLFILTLLLQENRTEQLLPWLCLRDSSKNHLLTTAVCSKKEFLKGFGVREDISNCFSSSVSAVSLEACRDWIYYFAFINLLWSDCCCALSADPSLLFPSLSPQVQDLDPWPVLGALNIWKSRVTARTPWAPCSARAHWRSYRYLQFLLQMHGHFTSKYTAKPLQSSSSEIHKLFHLCHSSLNTRPQQSFLPQGEMSKETGDRS